MASPKVKMMKEAEVKEEEVAPEPEPVVEEPEAAVVDEEAEEEYITVESLDPNEPLWEGGPTAGDVTAWKEEHGEVYVTSITLDKHIIWRPLTRGEYKRHIQEMEELVESGKLSSARASLYNEESVAETCILFPKYSREDKDSGLAGVPSIIAQEVMEASGFVAVEVRQL